MRRRVTRRDFLKITGAGGVGTLLSCSRPAQTLIPYVTPPEGAVPGVPVWYATVCRECPAGCGMILKTREGRAIKAEGNPSHPINAGKLCPRGQAALLGLYHPKRIRGPMMKDASGRFQSITWEKALGVLTEKMSAARGRTTAFVTPLLTGPLDDLVTRWTAALEPSRRITYEPLAQEQMVEANALSFGRRALPVYDLERAACVINFGADFLETWISPVYYARTFGMMRRPTDGAMARVIHVGPRLSMTAANADEWIGVVPGTEGVFILGMVRVILQEGLGAPGLAPGLRSRARALAEAYTPEAVAAKTGVPAADVVRVAREFGRASPGLALAGGPSASTRNGTSTQVLVNLLNALAGNVGKTVNFGEEESLGRAAPYRDLVSLATDMSQGRVGLLCLYNVNPVYTLPPSAGFADALSKAGFVVNFSTIEDETTGRSHLLLPDHHALESWGAYSPRTGVRGLLQPVMQPLFESRALGDVLLAAAAKALPWKTFMDYLRDDWKRTWRGSFGAGKFEEFWGASLKQGGWWRKASPAAPSFRAGALAGLPAKPSFEGEEKGGLYFLPSPSIRHYDGRSADRPWLQELPDPMTTVAWDSCVEVHPRAAKALGLSEGDEVAVTSPYGTVRGAVLLSPRIRPDTVSIPLGGKAGDNPLALLGPGPEPASGGLPLFSTRVTLSRTGRRMPPLVMRGSDDQFKRKIALTETLSALSGPGTGPRVNEWGFYPAHDHPEHRWGMAIDLSRCIGCGACVVACYAENNLAVVGRKLCADGREMSWIRIERFIARRPSGFPGVQFVPMLCQQCDRAPCEYVCPVFATYHNPEGLNAQVYNRCVGTRYCSNNCPYKVRRFNWFTYPRPEPGQLQLNPDVTVRQAGVMEKCTFCIQRIREGKDRAEDENRRVRDGEIVPACAQTCPTDAIVFGDLKDPGSLVSRTSRDRRGYQALADLNTSPAVTYLKKVIRG